MKKKLFIGFFAAMAMMMIACGGGSDSDSDSDESVVPNETPSDLSGTVWRGGWDNDCDIFTENCNVDGFELRFISENSVIFVSGDFVNGEFVPEQEGRHQSIITYTYSKPVGNIDTEGVSCDISKFSKFAIEGRKMLLTYRNGHRSTNLKRVK